MPTDPVKRQKRQQRYRQSDKGKAAKQREADKARGTRNPAPATAFVTELKKLTHAQRVNKEELAEGLAKRQRGCSLQQLSWRRYRAFRRHIALQAVSAARCRRQRDGEPELRGRCNLTGADGTPATCCAAASMRALTGSVKKLPKPL
jgi:hypothetical protein